MAFDWFRRKFSSGQSPEETGETSAIPEAKEADPSPTSQDSSEEPDEADDSETESADEDESLAWAKAAFANIKKKQAEDTSPDPKDSAPKDPESKEMESEEVEPAPDATSDDVESADVDSVRETEAEPEAAPDPEVTPVAETAAEPPPPPATSEPEAVPEAPSTALAEEIPTEEPAPETSTSPTPAPSEPAAEAETDSVASAPDTASPPKTNETAQEEEPEASPAAPLGLLARAEAEREERIERLKATAIEEPEPEPEEEDEEEIYSGPRITFDENFLWSAEVLAAQGRAPEDISYEEITWLNKLRQGLGKTRRGLVNQLKSIVGQGPLNDDAVMEIESLLLQADVGVDATDYIIEALQAKLREEALPPAQAIAYLKRLLRDLLDSPIKDDDSIVLAPEKDQLNIWLMTGVNGAGKTTTIGKLAHLAKKSDYRCLIGAADTFRAAAVEQVKVWGERSGIEVIANPGKNTDPAAVVFDAIAAAQSRDTELLLVDTAGRLQNKKNLMAELSKVRRIIDKKAPDAKVESLLVLDSTLGQNGLQQAKVFAEAADLSGVVLTKLDGTARGGVALAVVQQLGLPIRFIGAGEGISDLRPFSSYEFVEALLSG